MYFSSIPLRDTTSRVHWSWFFMSLTTTGARSFFTSSAR